MKVTIEEINTPTIYQFGNDAPELRIYSLESWITYDRQFIPRGDLTQKKGWYLAQACEITGGNIINVPVLELDSTEDAPPPGDEIGRYAARMCTQQGKVINIFPVDALASFYVPAVAELTWDAIVQYNYARKLYVPSSTYLDVRGVQALIDDALVRRGNIQNTAVMVGGTAIVLTDEVEADSIIVATGQDDSVTGTLHIENRLPGVGFSIVSNNGADSGIVGWVIF